MVRDEGRPAELTDDDLVDEFLREHPGADDRMRLALWLGRKVTPEEWPD